MTDGLPHAAVSHKNASCDSKGGTDAGDAATSGDDGVSVVACEEQDTSATQAPAMRATPMRGRDERVVMRSCLPHKRFSLSRALQL
jgi:hypothetical protein